MKTILSYVRHHPMVSFVILTYLLSWWTAPIKGGVILPWGPALAAWIVLAITEGKPGLGIWKQRLTNWRVAWYWYLVGPGMIAFYMTSAFGLNILLGATAAHFPLIPDLATFFTLLLLGGQWEEPGWTAFALPSLQKRFAARPYGALLAALAVGLLRASWHLPLVLSGHVSWFDMIFLSIAIQLIAAWLFNRTGSALVVMWTHFTSNLFGSSFSTLFTGSQWTDFYVMFVMLAFLIALGLLVKTGFKLGQEDTADKSVIVD